MIKALERESYSAAATAGVIVLLVTSILLLIGAVATAFLQRSDQSYLPIFVVSLAGGLMALLGTLFWYVVKARNRMRDESVEYDMTHPGFYDYYEQWQAKVEEITLNTSSL